jgi:uroporphyrinogen decarboxylase
LSRYVESVPVHAVSLDWTMDRAFALAHVPGNVAIQGNLDPVVLLAGGSALDREVDNILRSFADRPFIFNLGHGILPETPVDNVKAVVEMVREFRP